MAVRDMTGYFNDFELCKNDDKFVKNIDGVDYYFKSNDCIYNELLVSEVYKLLGLNVVDLELVTINDRLFLMSKSFRKDSCTYMNGYELLDMYYSSLTEDEIKELDLYKPCSSNSIQCCCPENNLETIWNALCCLKISSGNLRKLMVDFIKLYSMSIILGDVDFHPGNWELEISSDDVKLTPKFDNSYTFNSCNLVNSFFVDDTDCENTAIDSLKYFMCISCDDDKNIFNSLFYACHSELFKKAMNNVDNKYGEDIKQQFDKINSMSRGYILRRFNQTRDRIHVLKEEMYYHCI